LSLLLVLYSAPRFSGFRLSSKANISKFQFDLDVRHFSHEPLARVIAQALPVLDVKFHLHLHGSNRNHWLFRICVWGKLVRRNHMHDYRAIILSKSYALRVADKCFSVLFSHISIALSCLKLV